MIAQQPCILIDYGFLLDKMYDRNWFVGSPCTFEIACCEDIRVTTICFASIARLSLALYMYILYSENRLINAPYSSRSTMPTFSQTI